MMKVLIVLNHPYKQSYCFSVMQSVIAGLCKAQHKVDLLHLDAECFNPVMTAEDLKGYSEGICPDPKVLEYQQRIKEADHIVFIYPIWWETMPALMKGWIDKVITKGFAFDVDHKGLFPKFVSRLSHLKGITLITTMDTPAFIYRILFGNAIKKAFLTGTFKKIGIKKTKWINLCRVKFTSAERRKKWLKDIERYFALQQ